MLQVQLPTVFTAIATQPKINLLRLSTTIFTKEAKVAALSTTSFSGRGSMVRPGDVLSTFLITPNDECVVPFLWVIERSLGPKAQKNALAQASEDRLESLGASGTRDDDPSDSDSCERSDQDSNSDLVYSYVYHVALYGRGHIPLLANSRITLTNLAPTILQQPNAALRLRTNPGRPQSKKLPYREVFWPFKVDKTETEECNKEDSSEDKEVLEASNVCGLWDASIGPLHTVRVTALQNTRFSELADDAFGSDSDRDDCKSTPLTWKSKSSHLPFSRSSSTAGASKDSHAPFTTNKSDMSLSQHSSSFSNKRKPGWLHIVTDGFQDQYCMRRYTQTISLAPLKLSMKIPPQPPIRVPETDAVLAGLLDLGVESKPASEQLSPRISEAGGLASTPESPIPVLTLKPEPRMPELHTPGSQSIPSFIMGDAPKQDSGDTSPSSSLSSGSVGGSQKYYVTASTAWDVHAKDESKDGDDLSQFLAQPSAYSVARKRRLSELSTARDSETVYYNNTKAHANGSTSVALHTFLIALILVLIILVAVCIALMLTLSSPLHQEPKWVQARTTS